MPLGHNPSTRLMPQGHKVNVYGILLYKRITVKNKMRLLCFFLKKSTFYFIKRFNTSPFSSLRVIVVFDSLIGERVLQNF
jgi:hypothetical protein